LTLLYLDIDGFADYNRKSGRAAGDSALRAFAEVILAQTRAMNLAARFGNDEFIVALADADRRAGFIHASRISKAMAAHPLIASSGLHVSVGISSFSPRMAGFDDMIRAAQNDLAVRKKGGGRLTI
jgi:diguanylate cyclase (GGDEF)-like protein